LTHLANSLHGAQSFLTSQQFLTQSRNSLHFKEHNRSLPHSQQPVICPYPEPDRSSPTHTFYLKMHLNVMVPSMFMSSKWSLILELTPPKISWPLPYPPRYTFPAHLVLFHFIWVKKLTRRWPPDKEGVRECIERGTGWSFNLGMGEGLRTPHPKNLICYEFSKKVSVTHWNDT
jgi:hypothetical protein